MKPEQITAWALDEASPEERLHLEAALLENPQDKLKADETKAFCDFLLSELRDDSLAFTEEQRIQLKAQPVGQPSRVPSAGGRSALKPPAPRATRWNIGVIVRLAVAACVVLGGFWAWQSAASRRHRGLTQEMAVADKPTVRVSLPKTVDAKKNSKVEISARQPLKNAALDKQTAAVSGKLPLPTPVVSTATVSTPVTLSKSQIAMSPVDVNMLKQMQDQKCYGLDFGGRRINSSSAPVMVEGAVKQEQLAASKASVAITSGLTVDMGASLKQPPVIVDLVFKSSGASAILGSRVIIFQAAPINLEDVSRATAQLAEIDGFINLKIPDSVMQGMLLNNGANLQLALSSYAAYRPGISLPQVGLVSCLIPRKVLLDTNSWSSGSALQSNVILSSDRLSDDDSLVHYTPDLIFGVPTGLLHHQPLDFAGCMEGAAVNLVFRAASADCIKSQAGAQLTMQSLLRSRDFFGARSGVISFVRRDPLAYFGSSVSMGLSELGLEVNANSQGTISYVPTAASFCLLNQSSVGMFQIAGIPLAVMGFMDQAGRSLSAEDRTASGLAEMGVKGLGQVEFRAGQFVNIGGATISGGTITAAPSSQMEFNSSATTVQSGGLYESSAASSAKSLGKVQSGLASSSAEWGNHNMSTSQYQDVLRADSVNNAARRGMEAPPRTSPAVELELKEADSHYYLSVGNDLQVPMKDITQKQEGTTTTRKTDASGESYARIVENEMKEVAREPLSTLSIDVDTASYANVRRFLNQNMIPPPDAVRIEELVNYFPTSEEGPAHDAKEPFGVRIEMAPCPWQPAHRLARIAIKGREMSDERKPSNLVFLVDVSGSMNEPAKLPLVQQSLRMLTEQLGEGDHVTMVVYAGSSGVVLPPTGGEKKGEILAAIDRLSAGGSTHGSAGIKLAYEQAVAGFIKGGVNRVILCTDGDFNVGVSSPEELEKLIKHKAKTGVFLSVLGFGSGNLKDRTMETLADKGNGNYAYIDSLSEARKVLVEQMSGTLITIAKDVKIQVEFNPALARSYRLIGYENRLLAKEDFNDDTKDAGEIGAGHSVVALYEVVPATLPPGAESRPAVDSLKYQTPAVPPSRLADAAKNGEVMTVKLRYKEPDSSLSKLIETPVKDEGKTLTASSEEYKFSAAVAGFGLLLRDSSYKGTLSWETVRRLAMAGKGADKLGYRGEFLQLIDKARGLKETQN